MTESISDINRKHFDTIASTYDDKTWVKVGLKQISMELLAKRDWMGVEWVDEGEKSDRKVKMLDFACGPGMASATLALNTTLTHGIDISPAMATEYNRRAHRSYSPSRMFATAGDLLGSSPDPAISGSQFWNYDVAVVVSAFHHFPDPDLAAKRLVERLKQGGVLVVVDLVGHEKENGHSHGHFEAHNHGHSHGESRHGHEYGPKDHEVGKEADTQAQDAAHTVVHQGFSKSRISKILEAAGCVDVDYVVLDEPFKFGGAGEEGEMVKKVFMVKGKRG